VQRLRITFSKLGIARYIGHLDLHRSWERALRRGGVELAYTGGFHPQPRIQLASALPLGCTSEAEIADIWLSNALAPDVIGKRLCGVLPPGIEISSIVVVATKEKSLQSRLLSAVYESYPTSSCLTGQLSRNVDCLLGRKHVARSRRGKEYDLRPLIEQLVVKENADGAALLVMKLAARPGATGRPDEVMRELDVAEYRLHRTELVFIDKLD